MTTLIKIPVESRTYAFNFASQTEIADAAETLSGTPTVTSELLSGSGALTIGSPSISGAKVVVDISGGSEGDLHHLTASCSTSGGSILAVCGKLRVINC
jgi:hypothetical protein